MSALSVPFGLNVQPQTLIVSGNLVVPTATVTSPGMLSASDRQKVTNLVDSRLDSTVTGRKNFTNGLLIQNTDFKDAFEFKASQTTVSMSVLATTTVNLPVASSTSAGVMDSATYQSIQNLAIQAYARPSVSEVMIDARSRDSKWANTNDTRARVDSLIIRRSGRVLEIWVETFISTTESWPIAVDSARGMVNIGFNIPSSVIPEIINLSVLSSSFAAQSIAFVSTDLFVNTIPSDTSVRGNLILRFEYPAGLLLGPRRIQTYATVVIPT